MFEKITPEQAGIRSENVEKLISSLNSRNVCMHSLLMMKGNELFAEYYWAPYDKDTTHRMYSQTKSYVGIAIGLLIEDGKFSLDDTLVSLLPEKIQGPVHPYIARQTVRDTLMMRTYGPPSMPYNPDPVVHYLNSQVASVPPGSHWKYDSLGTQTLTEIAEKYAGKSLYDYLNEKIFRHLGTFQTAEILKIATGVSFGSSALVCTPRDMMSFGRFLANMGVWNGKRLMNEQFIREATSTLSAHEKMNFIGGYNTYGYGYKIWTTRTGGFFFNGLGGQYMIVDPKTDIIFVCTADSQGDDRARDYVVDRFFDLIVETASDTPLAENPDALASLEKATSDLRLPVARGNEYSPLQEKINGKTYVCQNNRQGITEFSLHFSDDVCEFRYTNEQGDKVIPFGIKRNEFSLFPQLGYSDQYFLVPTTNGHKYKCATSGAWVTDDTFALRVQIIDKYIGKLSCEFAFIGDDVAVTMYKEAEAFLNEYSGQFVATEKKN